MARFRYRCYPSLIATIVTLLWLRYMYEIFSSVNYTGDVDLDEDVVNYQEFEITNHKNFTSVNRTFYTQKQNDNSVFNLGNTSLQTSSGDNITIVQMKTGSKNCTGYVYNDIKNNTTPYKIYIYNLPHEMNADLVGCVEDKKIAYTNFCGFGPEMYKERDDITIRNTWQFSLDVIFHHKLIHSPYRTTDPESADVFYIPYYEALHCFCKGHGNNLTYNGTYYENALYGVVNRLPYYAMGKPHLITVAKIEREERSERCPLLRQKWLKRNVLLLGIEAYDKYRHSKQKVLPKFNKHLPFLAIPYPSYGHFLHSGDANEYRRHIRDNRKVLILLAASTRRSNPFRNNILDQMKNRTSLSITDYYSSHALPNDFKLQQMWFITPEAEGPHQQETMTWMKNSLFCLQPAGDSPTRKSLFDAIISGCIPVLFRIPYEPYVTYPYHDIIDYTKFTITVDDNQTFIDKLKPYLSNHELVVPLQNYLQSIMKYFQYSFPIDNRPHNDALKLILYQVGYHFKLQSNLTHHYV